MTFLKQCRPTHIMSAIIVSVFLLSFLPCVLCQTVVTTVPDTSNGDAYVAAVLGEANVTLECIAFFDGMQFTPSWFIQRESIDSGVVTIDVQNNGVPISPANLVGLTIPGPSFTILTIANFTDQFDMSIIQCGLPADRRTFHLGVPCMFTVLYQCALKNNKNVRNCTVYHKDQNYLYFDYLLQCTHYTFLSNSYYSDPSII